uniref:Recombinase A n=1 Tax=Palpitomonas bilix TaxID=652834 RepID=A0A7S3DB29_9EUKA|mmetsp:Transcript_29441/g.75966  ORF Transcript_29441/g.75966 Transcript_29441/m.75966 type:complete len:439 (+) Transcript_29441:94-1410(+)
MRSLSLFRTLLSHTGERLTSLRAVGSRSTVHPRSHHPAWGLACRAFTQTAIAQRKAPALDVVSHRGPGRDAALDAAMKQIEKSYGKNAVLKLGDALPRTEVDVISTGSLSLDLALGVGGLPRGRIIEVYGPEMSGKTTLALHAVAEAQKKQGKAVFVDVEHALDPTYAERLGVQTKELLVSQPDTGEQALEIVDTLVRSGAVDIVVLDSVAALVPRAELEGDMGDHHIGLQARLMSQALRKLTASINRSNCIVLFLNQTRHKVGTLPFMNPETTSGGNALKFYCSVRLEIRKVTALKKGSPEVVYGNRVRVKVAKNKLAPPFRQTEFDIEFGRGISRYGELLDEGLKMGIVQKSGAWYSYEGEQLGQGRDRAKEALEGSPELSEKIEVDIRSRSLQLASDPATKAKAENIEDVSMGDTEAVFHASVDETDGEKEGEDK